MLKHNSLGTQNYKITKVVCLRIHRCKNLSIKAWALPKNTK